MVGEERQERGQGAQEAAVLPQNPASLKFPRLGKHFHQTGGPRVQGSSPSHTARWGFSADGSAEETHVVSVGPPSSAPFLVEVAEG